MTSLDYAIIDRYWSRAEPSILGPYMMEGFGFPASAGRYRFGAEATIVDRLIGGADRDGTVLDLGSGNGCWTEYFASRFLRVVAVEASRPLYEAQQERCATFLNVKSILGNVMLFKPKDRYEVIFLGGILMYLNENDVVSLLSKLKSSLVPGGVILCRESTVRSATITRSGEYQAAYRSVEGYTRLFKQCGLSVTETELNVPYVLLQMGCEFVEKWKSLVPLRSLLLPVFGSLVYWGLRLGNPWITHIPQAMGVAYPKLTNHYFTLRA